jgi:hypothetical protein
MTGHEMVERLGSLSSPIMRAQQNKTEILRLHITLLETPHIKERGETGPFSLFIMLTKRYIMTWNYMARSYQRIRRSLIFCVGSPTQHAV